MKILSLSLRIIAICAGIVAVVGWFSTNDRVADANNRIAQARQEVDAARQQQADAEEKFRASDARANTLDTELADAKSRATSARSQLAQAQREVTELKSDIKSKEADIRSLETQNSKLRQEIIAAKTEVPSGLDADKERQLTSEISDLKSEVAELKRQLKEAKEASPTTGVATTESTAANTPGITTATTVTPRPAAPQMATGTAKASILKSDPDNGIIIISRGQKGGLQREMEFGIAKGFSAPVRVKVQKVTPDISVAHILPGSKKVSFEEGDEITLIQ